MRRIPGLFILSLLGLIQIACSKEENKPTYTTQHSKEKGKAIPQIITLTETARPISSSEEAALTAPKQETSTDNNTDWIHKAKVMWLMAQLKSTNYEKRVAAVRGLGELGVHLALPEIRVLISDPHPNVRGAVIDVMAQLQDKENAYLLIPLLSDEERCLRYSSAEALGKLGCKEAIPNLTKALIDEDWVVRGHSALALATLEARESIPEIIKLLGGNWQGEGWDVVKALIQLDARESIPGLVKLLYNPYDRPEASYGLRELKAKEAIPSLISMLCDKDTDIVSASAGLLVELNATESIPDLLQLLNSNDEPIRRISAISLAKLDIKESIPELMKMAGSASKYDYRRWAIHFLGKLKAQESVEQLRNLLQDDKLKDSAALALAEIGVPDAATIIMQILETKQYFAHPFITALGKLGAHQAIPLIRKQLNSDKHRQEESVEAAIRSLTELNDRESIPKMMELLNNDNCLEVRGAVVDALVKFNGQQAIPELIKLLTDEKGGNHYESSYSSSSPEQHNNYIRALAAISLIELGAKDKIQPDNIEDIRSILASEKCSGEVKSRAQAALKLLGVPDK